MALKISEKTELKVSLKNVIGIIVTVVMASYAWFNVQERITSLEDTINKNGDIMRQNSSFKQAISKLRNVSKTTQQKSH